MCGMPCSVRLMVALRSVCAARTVVPLAAPAPEAGSDDTAALRMLADVVEPVKGYSREKTAPTEPTSATPLNRLIDATRPESDTARRFANLVDAVVSGQSNTPQSKAEIRAMLTRWRDNQAKLEPLLQNSFLLKEADPVSRNLSAVSAAGLRALDYLESGERAPEAWKAQQLALLEQAKKPSAQLLLMIAPSVQKLIQVSAGEIAAALFDSPAERGNRFVELAAFIIGAAKIVMGFGEIVILRDGRLE